MTLSTVAADARGVGLHVVHLDGNLVDQADPFTEENVKRCGCSYKNTRTKYIFLFLTIDNS